MPLGVEHICREFARRAKNGLLHLVPVRHGFKVSKKGKNKTKRTWKPNVQRVMLYSEALDKRMKLTVTTTTLRSPHAVAQSLTRLARAIDYHGGLDNYLLEVPEKFRTSKIAKTLRAQITAARKKQLSGTAEGKAAMMDQKKSVAERFYIEKVLKPGGHVALEMVSNLTGQRLDKKTKQEIVPDPEGQKQIFKSIPQPKPVNIEKLRRKYGIE